MRAVPMAVIARQLGHADTRMTERHYAHLAPNYVADTIRANFPIAPNYVADTIRANFPRLTGSKATVLPIAGARIARGKLP